MDTRITGIVLTAGRSSRMGMPKALLEHEGEPFLARCIATLRAGGCEPVLAVVAEGADEIEAIARSAGARVVSNPDSAAEQVDSLRLALNQVGETAEAIVFTPVDAPRVEAATVRALIRALEASSAPVVVPVFEGERGHPTLFARTAFPALLTGALEEGARTVIDRYEADLREVPVEDRAVLDDFDTPDRLPRRE